MNKPVLYLIGGPTASGKSALAVEIAQRENGVVINTDAMQVYAGLPILTAQPDATMRASVPHALYEIFSPSEPSSAGRWLEATQGVIQKTVNAGRTPILVGGTGLYFKALEGGLADIPPIPPDVRDDAQKSYDTLGEAAFRARLGERDPESAQRIKPNDRQRLVRAYEVVAHTGQPLSFWQKNAAASSVVSDFQIERRLVLPPRDVLYAKCEARFDAMLKQGALDEARSIMAQDLDPALPAMKILGLRELIAYLKNECSLDEATTQAKQATRNYAKRQITWFKNQWPE